MLSEQLRTASKPDYTVIPVQLSAEEFERLYPFTGGLKQL
jgi:hypothetical protein